jgi:hypothetical protein
LVILKMGGSSFGASTGGGGDFGKGGFLCRGLGWAEVGSTVRADDGPLGDAGLDGFIEGADIVVADVMVAVMSGLEAVVEGCVTPWNTTISVVDIEGGVDQAGVGGVSGVLGIATEEGSAM